jgi:hypothetical protein
MTIVSDGKSEFNTFVGSEQENDDEDDDNDGGVIVENSPTVTVPHDLNHNCLSLV